MEHPTPWSIKPIEHWWYLVDANEQEICVVLTQSGAETIRDTVNSLAGKLLTNA